MNQFIERLPNLMWPPRSIYWVSGICFCWVTYCTLLLFSRRLIDEIFLRFSFSPSYRKCGATVRKEMGNWSGVAGRYGVVKCTTNGELLLYFCSEHSLIPIRRPHGCAHGTIRSLAGTFCRLSSHDHDTMLWTLGQWWGQNVLQVMRWY